MPNSWKEIEEPLGVVFKKNAIHALIRSDFFMIENDVISSVFVDQDLSDEAFEMVEEIVEYLMQLQRNRIKRKRFKDVKNNGSTFSPIDEDGNELDAEVTIETWKGKVDQNCFSCRRWNETRTM